MRDHLKSLTCAKRLIVGFSGGADSTALLLALYRQRDKLGAKIEACHFNHGLHPESDAWQAHCEAFCADRHISLHCQHLNLSGDLSNLENRARDLRYQWVAEHIDADTAYLTGHHADDRAETFLLNALRGSGLEGVSSIPQVRRVGNGHVIRPLLEYSRTSLQAYVAQHGVSWVEDPSNQDSGPDRNLIRNEVIPLLESRWPAARSSLARTSAHLRSSSTALSQLLGHTGELDGFDKGWLPLESLALQEQELPVLMLREWLRRNGTPSVPETRLGEFLEQVRKASVDSKCELSWEGHALRLYRGGLHLSASTELPPCPRLKWDGRSRLELGPGLGELEITGRKPPALEGWKIGPRCHGVRIRVRRDGPARKLKKVLQEQNIPPWQRLSVPILYDGDDVLAIGDWTYAAKFRHWLDEHELGYRWQPEQAELQSLQSRCQNATQYDQSA